MAYDRSQAESEKPGSSAKVRYVVATDGDVGQRLDNFLLRELKGVPRTHVYRLLRKGEVRVNSKRARPDQRVAAGDRVRLPPVRRPDQRKLKDAKTFTAASPYGPVARK